MVRFAPPEVFDEESPAAEPLGEAPVALPRRRSRRLAAPSIMPTNPLLQQAFPSWARPPKEPAVGADAGFEAAFFAGAGLALFDKILRPGDSGAEPAFAGALRQRLALRAASACAALARHREDERALRDAEHLSPNAGGSFVVEWVGGIESDHGLSITQGGALSSCFAPNPPRLSFDIDVR